MTVSVDGFTLSRLTAQPFGYQASDLQSGLSAKSWQINGLATPAEWLDLLTAYDTWRDTKITEDPVTITNDIGAVVLLTASGPGGQSWEDVECWFTEAPSGEQVGAYIRVSFVLVDANQALEVALRQEELSAEEADLDLGTITIGTTELKLLKQPDSYTFGPTLEQTANGAHYLSGPLTVTEVKSIEGQTDSAGWADIRSWYQTVIATPPETGDYFPLAPPEASAERKVVNGLKTIVYIVTVELALVK